MVKRQQNLTTIRIKKSTRDDIEKLKRKLCFLENADTVEWLVTVVVESMKSGEIEEID